MSIDIEEFIDKKHNIHLMYAKSKIELFNHCGGVGGCCSYGQFEEVKLLLKHHGVKDISMTTVVKEQKQ